MVGVAQRFIDGAVGILLSLQNIQADTPPKAEGSGAVLPQVIRQLRSAAIPGQTVQGRVGGENLGGIGVIAQDQAAAQFPVELGDPFLKVRHLPGVGATGHAHQSNRREIVRHLLGLNQMNQLFHGFPDAGGGGKQQSKRNVCCL